MVSCTLTVELKASLNGLGYILTDILLGVLRKEKTPGSVVEDLEDVLKLVEDITVAVPDACSEVKSALGDIKRYVILSRCSMLYIMEVGVNNNVLMESLLWLVKSIQRLFSLLRYF